MELHLEQVEQLEMAGMTRWGHVTGSGLFSVPCLLGVARHLAVANLGFLTEWWPQSVRLLIWLSRVSTGVTREQGTKRRGCLLHDSLVAVAD